MDSEQRIAQLEHQMEELLETAEDNNRLLRSIQRSMRWGFWGRLLVWIIVLALPFIVLGPFLQAVVPNISGNEEKNLFGLPSADQVQGLLNAYKSASSTSSGTPVR